MEKVQVESAAIEKSIKQVRLLAEKVNNDIYSQRKDLIGKILTIVDATTADTVQRKALKDMVTDAFYSGSYWNNSAVFFEAYMRANNLGPLHDNETYALPTSAVIDWNAGNVPIVEEFKNI